MCTTHSLPPKRPKVSTTALTLKTFTIELMQIALQEAAHTQDDSFFVADMKDVLRQKQLWSSKLPRVHPYYGMTVRSHC